MNHGHRSRGLPDAFGAYAAVTVSPAAIRALGAFARPSFERFHGSHNGRPGFGRQRLTDGTDEFGFVQFHDPKGIRT